MFQLLAAINETTSASLVDVKGREANSAWNAHRRFQALKTVAKVQIEISTNISSTPLFSDLKLVRLEDSKEGVPMFDGRANRNIFSNCTALIRKRRKEESRVGVQQDQVRASPA